jgi:general stress protein 26
MTIVEKLNELIAGIEIAMLTTLHPNSQMHSRPMATQAVVDDGYLWFFSALHSSKTDEIRNLNQVNLAYSDPGNLRFVSVSGTCELIRNRIIAAELWRPEYSRWFPGGLDDPDLILLKVTVNGVEYWDVKAARMRTIDDFAAEHGTIQLRDERTEVA